ncbi:wound-induced protein 1-like [Gastrolobium bilobum]|uniref:wound-induced protein 1-like n=1 Tax=Gastrolobium bilobum TaxID=150636 RepID=UPI002AB08361|nr:wound-induced protein 1-like [Gastrolobium bilobum]
MRMLTGDSSAGNDNFKFVPQSLASFGPTVIVEGCDISRAISWIHAWTVTDGLITQVREYFNTSLTVTRIADSDSDSEEIVPAASDSNRFPCVWESSVSNRVGKSVPGLVLAI